MKQKLLSILLLLALLTACTTPPTPFLDVTTTPTTSPSQTFAARLALGSVNPTEIKAVVYVAHLTYNLLAPSSASPLSLVEPSCYQLDEKSNCLHDTLSVMANNVLLVIEAGHWCATPTGDDYTAPQPCAP